MTASSQKPSQNSQTAPSRDKQRTVAALKYAARKQLISKGISGASVQLILDRAGLSRGALFHHFATKNHLIAAAFDDILRFAATRLQTLGTELRIGLITRPDFVRGARDTFCSELFIASMEVALHNRLDPAMNALITESVENWWARLTACWTDTFDLPGMDEAAARQHWVMASNLLRGHAFTMIYRDTPDIAAEFCAAFEGMILSEARIKPLDDSFAALEADLREAVGLKLFTALAVLPEEVERIYSNHPEAYPLTGRKRLDASPWGDHVIASGTPWLGHDLEDLRQMFPDYQTIAGLGCGSCINIPVRVEDRTIGSLNLLDAAHAYTAEDVARAGLFARRAVPLFQETLGATQ